MLLVNDVFLGALHDEATGPPPFDVTIMSPPRPWDVEKYQMFCAKLKAQTTAESLDLVKVQKKKGEKIPRLQGTNPPPPPRDPQITVRPFLDVDFALGPDELEPPQPQTATAIAHANATMDEILDMITRTRARRQLEEAGELPPPAFPIPDDVLAALGRLPTRDLRALANGEEERRFMLPDPLPRIEPLEAFPELAPIAYRTFTVDQAAFRQMAADLGDIPQ